MPFEADKTYTVTVADAYPAKSSKGTMGICLVFGAMLDDPGSANEEGGPEPCQIENNFWLSPTARAMSIEKLTEAFGATEAIMQEAADKGNLPDLFIGKECEITTKLEPKYGVQVAFVNPVGGGSKKASKPIDNRQDMARFRGLLGGGPMSSPAYSQRSSAVLDDEDEKSLF